MAPRKTSKSASKDVESAMHKRKEGTLRSGRSGKKVTSKKQAIAIGLQKREKGQEGPEKEGDTADEIERPPSFPLFNAQSSALYRLN